MFMRSCEVRLPSDNPTPFFSAEKLSMTCPCNHKISESLMYLAKIFFNISWSMFAKNFLMSHFKIQHVLVLFAIFRANARNGSCFMRTFTLCTNKNREWNACRSTDRVLDIANDGWPISYGRFGYFSVSGQIYWMRDILRAYIFCLLNLCSS